MEAATFASVPVRFVVANQHPDHDTICTFRRRLLEPFSGLFVHIRAIVHHMGLVEVGNVAINGSKSKAKDNASKHKVMSWERATIVWHMFSKDEAYKGFKGRMTKITTSNYWLQPRIPIA